MHSSIENNYDTGKPVSILPLIKQQTDYLLFMYSWRRIKKKAGFDNERHWPLPRTTLLEETIQTRMEEVSKRHNHDPGK